MTKRLAQITSNQVLFLVGLSIWSGTLFALVPDATVEEIPTTIDFRNTRIVRELLSRNFKNPTPSTQSFALGSQSFSLKNFLTTFAINPYVALRPKQVNTKKIEYSFYFGSYPICHARLTESRSESGYSFFTGEYPDIKANNTFFTLEDFPQTENVEAILEEHFTVGIHLDHFSHCLWSAHGYLTPALDAGFFLNGIYYKAFVSSSEIMGLSKVSFHVDGIGHVYKKNSLDALISAEVLNGLKGTGRLESERITTNTGKNARAYNLDHDFDFSPTDPAFHETSVFFHAQEMHNYFNELGYHWHLPNPLTLVLNIGADEADFDVNNAFYQPSSSSKGLNNGPIIVVGEGNGYVLKNLTLDADVISHEFSHHVIFEHLNDTSNYETLTLHEGLADFFTFARTGDSCLGESICPLYSPFCIEQGACLRSGNNTVRFGDSTYQSWGHQPHFQGQLISATLWDLYASGLFERKALAQIVFNSLKLVPGSAFIEDFFVAFLLADRDSYGDTHTCAIFEAFDRRGFSTFTSKYDCSDLSQLIINQNNGSDNAIPNLGEVPATSTINEPKKLSKSSQVKKRLGLAGCGIILPKKSDRGTTQVPGEALFLFMLPLIGIIVPRRKSLEPR